MESEFQVQNIALKTLKQRCDYLQQRLDHLEEENCKLKLAKANSNTTVSKDSSDRSLEEQLIIAKKEKSQMAHQIQMITTENFNLWSQLAKALPESDITAQKLSFSSVSSGHPVFKFKQTDNPMSSSSNILDDYSKESLEEISLKLINGILMGKNELENQYSQMIDLQKENSGEEINLILSKQSDNRALTKNIKDYVQKLKDFKQVLYQQKNDLKNVITVMQNLDNSSGQSNFVSNKDIVHHVENDVKASEPGNLFQAPGDGKVGNEEEGNKEMICPFCSKSFTGRFQIIFDHVVGHFESYDDAYDNFVDASSNFES